MWVVILVLIIILIFLISIKENLFIKRYNAEFKGINILGNNSTDTAIPTKTPAECQEICARNEECFGWSYYVPGQRCTLFFSGNFVPNNCGYISGKKV